MAGNSWQQPVAGQPSCGSLHPAAGTMIVENVDPSASGWTLVDASSVIPAGSTTVYVRFRMQGTAAGQYAILSDATARTGAFEIVQYIQAADQINNAYGFISVTSSRTVSWYASSSGLYGVYVYVYGYTL